MLVRAATLVSTCDGRWRRPWHNVRTVRISVVWPQDLARFRVLVVVVLIDGLVGQAEGCDGRPECATGVLCENVREE